MLCRADWAPEHIAHSFVHASYNTLSLFSVRTTSSHFVTTVSPHATEKRLTFNGWMQSAWVPSIEDPLEEMLNTPEKRHGLTHSNFEAIREIVEDKESDLDPKRREVIEALMQLADQELHPQESVVVRTVAL